MAVNRWKGNAAFSDSHAPYGTRGSY